jgi:thioredoxin-dependent peroxiredoxin
MRIARGSKRRTMAEIRQMTSIQVGDQAPDVTVETHDGRRFTLSDFRGQRVVVLFFYPSDGTPVCTAESCAFRDSYADFVAAGAVVIGVSSDSPERHRTFAAEHRLPFFLVSDPSGELRKAFGVPKMLALLPGRATYAIDTKGVVRLIFNSPFAASRHVTEALRVVKQLAGESV